MRYYEDYIQSQVRSGRDEQQVLDELGDPRLIARTLLDVYKRQALHSLNGTPGANGENQSLRGCLPDCFDGVWCNFVFVI